MWPKSLGILEDIERAGLEQALLKVDGLDAKQASMLQAGLIPDLLQRCHEDGLFWLRWVQTRDEADPGHSVKPFPTHLDYLRSLWQLLVQHQCVVVAKSRQMLVSWAVAAFCCWWARFQANQAIYWQTQQWEDACAMICQPVSKPMGRCQFIEANLPEWMRQDLKPSEGCLTYPNGSAIYALPGGADKIRGKVASVIIQDEFAMQLEATGVYTACAPLIQKGAKFIAVSTPNGSSNTFATLYHGRPVGIPE